ncbi:MAG: hypothetical protein ABWY71_02945 [Candidatus Saccharimonadales bacterium]
MVPDSNYDFSGVWLSTYAFTSGLTGDVLETEHYVTMQRLGNQLVVQSIPNTSGSYMMARFTLDGPVATGSYQSQNSPLSSTKGAIYYGAAQLVMNKNGKLLKGMAVGFGKDMQVKPSDWQIEHVGQHHPKRKELEEVQTNKPAAAKKG